jgi:hypothetical protein
VSQNGSELRDRHVGALMSQLAADTSTLVRQELQLARAELTERLDAVRSEVGEAMQLARTESAQKLDQAKADLAGKGKQAGIGAGMFGAAGVAALLALGSLTACLILLLDRWLAPEAAAAILALAWALVAAAAALRGRDKVHEAGGLDPSRYLPEQTIATVKSDLRKVADPKQAMPEHTIETLKEDVEWAKTRGRSDAR